MNRFYLQNKCKKELVILHFKLLPYLFLTDTLCCSISISLPFSAYILYYGNKINTTITIVDSPFWFEHQFLFPFNFLWYAYGMIANYIFAIYLFELIDVLNWDAVGFLLLLLLFLSLLWLHYIVKVNHHYILIWFWCKNFYLNLNAFE